MKKAKHPLRKPVTPASQIRSALRQLWLRSRERGQAVKDQHNTCQTCGRKGSAAKGREVKINVHHREGVDWNGVIQLIRDRLLQTPDKYVCMCEECHVKLHKEEKEKDNEPN